MSRSRADGRSCLLALNRLTNRPGPSSSVARARRSIPHLRSTNQAHDRPARSAPHGSARLCRLLHALHSWLDSWREITTQRGLHVGRQIIVALPREHDGLGGQSDLPLSDLGREGAPGLEMELLGKCIASSPMAFNRAAVVTVS